MAEGTYSPIILKEFSGGLVSRYDRESDNLNINESPDLENVDFDGKGSFKIRNGYELFGNRTTGGGSITTDWTYKRAIRNDKIPIRQRDTVLEYYHSGTAQWETIKVTLTTGYTMGYENFTSATDTIDYLYFCDGNINLYRWTGGHTQLNGALAGAEGTVTVDSTTGFPSSGSIVIGTTTVTYSGVTATTFTGCVGTPAAADNAAVTDLPTDFSASAGTKAKGNIMTVYNNQLVIANGQYIQLCDIDDFTDWQVAAGKLSFSKGFAGGNITGLRSRNNTLIVFTKDAIYGLTYTYANDLQGFQVNVDTIESAPNIGPVSNRAIVQADGEIFYMGADGVIRNLVNSSVSAIYNTGSISENIKNQLNTYQSGLTSCVAGFDKNKLYFAVKSNESTVNDLVFVYDFKYSDQTQRREAWTKYRLYVNGFFNYNDGFFFSSSGEPNSFRLFKDADGNDITTDDEGAISWYYKTPLFDFDKPELKFRLKKVVLRGFISTNSQININAIYDYGTTSSLDQNFLGSNTTYVSTPSVLALGESVIAEDTMLSDEFNGQFPFTYPFDFGIYDSYNIQLKISGGTTDEKFKLTRLMIYIEPQKDVTTN
jgi:hypothetical protein